MDAQHKAARRRSTPARASTDISLVLYALAAGILIVSAAVLLAKLERQWSPFTGAVTVVATAIATVIAGISADSVVRWFRSSR